MKVGGPTRVVSPQKAKIFRSNPETEISKSANC